MQALQRETCWYDIYASDMIEHASRLECIESVESAVVRGSCNLIRTPIRMVVKKGTGQNFHATQLKTMGKRDSCHTSDLLDRRRVMADSVDILSYAAMSSTT